jgi:hypothetical protein
VIEAGTIDTPSSAETRLRADVIWGTTWPTTGSKPFIRQAAITSLEKHKPREQDEGLLSDGFQLQIWRARQTMARRQGGQRHKIEQ